MFESKKIKIIILGISVGLISFLLIIGTLLDEEVVLTGKQQDMIADCIEKLVTTKVYTFEVENPDSGEGKWLTIDSVPIDKDTIANKEIMPERFSELKFTLNDKYAGNDGYTLIDCGFYVWLEMKEGESKDLTFSLEYGENLLVSAETIVSYNSEYGKGRGIVKLQGIDASMKDITYLTVKLDCKEMNNDTCVAWSFSNMQISYNY